MSGGENDDDDSNDRMRVEARLARRFFKAFERQTEQLELRRDFRLSEREQKVLYDLVTANLWEGLAAGVITFVVLRRLRAAYYKRLTGGPVPPKPPAVPNAFNSPFLQQNPPVQQQQQLSTAMEGLSNQNSFRWNRVLFNTMTLLLDGMLAFYVSLYVSTRKTDVFLQKVTEIPLLEGQSTVADELCPVFLNELQAIRREQQNHPWSEPARALEHPETPALQCLLDFCTNCQRRAAYEALLRRERGLPPTEPVAIPPPGVPLDVAFTDLLADGNGVWDVPDTEGLDDDDDDASANVEDIDSMNLTDWAEDFVSDQEEDDPRRRRPSS